MNRLTGKEIRKTWIKFFESKGHKWLPGVNLIPQGDKSLLWVNAGVTGLKKYFDGSEIPPCRRIVNVQKSIRTNDIDNVGYTARHHTFFEMLGNFSIGDYFRKEVIAWAFEILTSKDYFGMPIEKLYMTYNPSDLESRQFWMDNGVPENHLIPLEGNYWQIGEGPCGPNTEVFFDRGEKWDPEHLGDKLLREEIENDRYIEIWGIVFSQYNAVNGVKREDYKELPSKNIDTGSGLERIACILQETDTNFETDLFMPIIEATGKLAKLPYEKPNLMPYRVIADHARTLTFSLSDGAYFSNEGRGYVLRRIIRRAMRYAQKIGINGAFMYKLVDVVVENYKDFYPELVEKAEFVKKIIKGEEEKFIKTLTAGEEMLKNIMEGKSSLSGEEVFRLYDTYGFPSELTKEMCAEKGVTVDMEGFEKCMEEQKERARNARGDIESFHKQSKDLLAFKAESTFNYDGKDIESTVIGLFKDGEKVDSIDEEGEIAFAVTPFYAECGGQVSDTGTIEGKDFRAKVISVSKAPAGQHLHKIAVEYGTIKEGDKVTLRIDHLRRNLIMRNHSATHLLHAAIGEVLGYHVDQKGSFVNEEYLRFDFSTLSKLTKDDIAKIESIVNSKIAESLEGETKILPIEEAKKIGAEMEFSEKYGDTVRVVCFGDYSKEFCGGTHVSNAEQIGVFAIISEEAIASGIRRITATTSLGALSFLNEQRKTLGAVEETLGGVAQRDVLGRVNGLKEEIVSGKAELSALKDKMNAESAKGIASSFKEINGVSFLFKFLNGSERGDLLSLADNLKGSKKDHLIVLVGGSNGAHPIVVMAGGSATSKIKAGDAIKKIATVCGGSGGGRPEMASGQLKDVSSIEKAIAEIEGSL